MPYKPLFDVTMVWFWIVSNNTAEDILSGTVRYPKQGATDPQEHRLARHVANIKQRIKAATKENGATPIPDEVAAAYRRLPGWIEMPDRQPNISSYKTPVVAVCINNPDLVIRHGSVIDAATALIECGDAFASRYSVQGFVRDACKGRNRSQSPRADGSRKRHQTTMAYGHRWYFAHDYDAKGDFRRPL